MFLITIAPVSPGVKPSRIVCANETELIAEINMLSQSPEVVSYLVERVSAYEPVK